MHDFLARASQSLLHRRCGRRGEADRLQSRAPSRIPAQGPAVPRRLRDDADPVQLRVRASADGHGNRMQPRRRRLSARDEQPGGAGIASPTRRTRPNWAPTTSNSTFRRGRCPAGPRSSSNPMSGPASTPPNRRRTRDGAHIVMIGILPTLMPEHLSGGWMSESIRYQALNDSIFTARGEDIMIDIAGPERLSLQTASDRARIRLHQHAIAPAGLPRGLREELERRAGDWRARSWRSAPTRRTSSATSCGRRPASSCSPRPPTPGPTNSRRRACGRASGSASGGSRRSSICSRRTSATSRRCCPSCPTRIRSPNWPQGRTRELPELRLHNGTIYRWNRPVYDVVDGRPHLRVENRVLPAGPTVVDMMANSAFYYGVLRSPVRRGPPAVDEDEFRCGTPELPRSGPARDGRPAVLARPRRGDTRRAGAASAAADGPRGSAALGCGRST